METYGDPSEAKVQVSTDQPSSREGQQRGPWVALRVAPRVAQTKHEQVDKNGFETDKNDLGSVWLQSIFLKRFCLIFRGVLGSENSDFA